MSTNKRADPETSVVECPYCGERFPDEPDDVLPLHEGLEHYGRLSDAEQEAFAEAYEREQSDLRTFQLQALLVLVAIYFGFILVYALVG